MEYCPLLEGGKLSSFKTPTTARNLATGILDAGHAIVSGHFASKPSSLQNAGIVSETAIGRLAVCRWVLDFHIVTNRATHAAAAVETANHVHLILHFANAALLAASA